MSEWYCYICNQERKYHIGKNELWGYKPSLDLEFLENCLKREIFKDGDHYKLGLSWFSLIPKCILIQIHLFSL